MADITSIPTHGGIQAGYNYTPVETRLNPPIHLDPVNYDALQKAISGIPGLLMSSPLNPAVRAQMQEEAARYNLGKDVIAGLSPEDRARRVGVTSQGPEIIPGYQVGNVGPPAPAPPAPTDNNNNGDNTNNPQPTVDNTNNPEIAGTGGPGITTPQTNQYSPPGQTGGIQQKAQPQSPFATPKQNTAPEVPTDNRTFANPNQKITQAQPQSPAGVNLTDQQALLQWQNQNAHPVMSSQDALTWAKNFDTSIRKAVYLPNGGPGGQPAYMFSDGKNSNVVPISQIAKNGGQGLIAGQNTSQVLNAADIMGQQQQQNGQQPQQPGQQMAQQGLVQGQQQPGQQQPLAAQPGQQLAQNVPAAPRNVTANTPLSPEEKAYMASQGDLGVLSADTNNDQLLKNNHAANVARGDTQLAPNTIRDNLSNVPRSTDPLHNDPVPPGAVPGQQDQYANNLLQQVQKTAGGLNSLPDAGPDHPGVKKLGGPNPQTGVQWYVDSNPDPANPDSHWPFLIMQTSPWSEKRMYNPVGNEWIPVEVVRPDRVLDQQILDKTGQDSTTWKLPNGQPDQGRKIQALRDDYNIHNTLPMTPEVQGKLESMRSQVIQSQRIMEGIRDGHMTDSDWGWFKNIQSAVADQANAMDGIPYAEAWWRAANKAFAPGGVDPKLRVLSDAYGTLMAGRNDPNLTTQERAELDHITMGTTLPARIQQLNYSRMMEYNRYYNQAVANRMRISDDHMGTADEITQNHRVRDVGAPNFSNLGTGTPPSNSPMVLRAQPAAAPGATPQATPQPTPVPNNSQNTPYDLSQFGDRNGQIAKARQLPSGTWVKSGNNVFQVP
jgi:hypothetical protein